MKEGNAQLYNAVAFGSLFEGGPALGRSLIAGRTTLVADGNARHFFIDGDKGRGRQMPQQVVALLWSVRACIFRNNNKKRGRRNVLLQMKLLFKLSIVLKQWRSET